MDEKKILISRTEDLFRLCEKYSCARFSPFLDGGELAEIEDNFITPYGFNVMFFGGASNCERKIMGVFPDWEEPSEEVFPIKAVRFESGFSKQLTHRDYLGTLMSLGIERDKTGDIIIDGKTAYAFVSEDIADYIKNNIKKIGNQGIKVQVLDTGSFEMPQIKYEEMYAVCASQRLDAVVGAAANVSRSIAAGLINGGKVKLNYREADNVSKTVNENDLISIRGYGRFIFCGMNAQTRKGRIHIKLYKYI